MVPMRLRTIASPVPDLKAWIDIWRIQAQDAVLRVQRFALVARPCGVARAGVESTCPVVNETQAAIEGKYQGRTVNIVPKPISADASRDKEGDSSTFVLGTHALRRPRVDVGEGWIEPAPAALQHERPVMRSQTQGINRRIDKPFCLRICGVGGKVYRERFDP